MFWVGTHWPFEFRENPVMQTKQVPVTISYDWQFAGATTVGFVFVLVFMFVLVLEVEPEVEPDGVGGI